MTQRDWSSWRRYQRLDHDLRDRLAWVIRRVADALDHWLRP